jgi:outer membrane protein OmpA-like peptidoglycan-associated protein
MSGLSLRTDEPGTPEPPPKQGRGSLALYALLGLLMAGLGFLGYQELQHRRALEAQMAALQAQSLQSAALARQAQERAAAAEASARAAAEGRQVAEAQTSEAQQQAEAAKKEAGSAREAAAQAQAEADRIRKRAEAEVNRLEAALGQIAETRRTQLGLILNLGSDHLKFEFDKAELRPEDKELLARIAGILMTSHDYTVSVNGHTDDVGSAAYNQALSERRARAVHDYLVKAGLPAEILSVQGHGKSRPLVPGTSEAARAKNRRVELGIVNTQIRYAR